MSTCSLTHWSWWPQLFTKEKKEEEEELHNTVNVLREIWMMSQER